MTGVRSDLWGILAAVLICVSPVVAGTAIVPTLATPREPSQNANSRHISYSGIPSEETEGPALNDFQREHPFDMNSAAQMIAARCQTGTLLFSAGDCLAVRAYTGSRFTHVATVVIRGDEVWIYDSMNGAGVRKLLLQDYLEVQSPDEVTLLQPHRKFSDEEACNYHAALERQLGRPYSVKHFISGKRCAGLHCAEYVTDALIEIDWLRAENPVQVSPASLLEGISQDQIYTAGELYAIPQALEPIPEPEGWCARAWQNTTLCVGGGCVQLSRWILCR